MTVMLVNQASYTVCQANYSHVRTSELPESDLQDGRVTMVRAENCDALRTALSTLTEDVGIAPGSGRVLGRVLLRGDSWLST